MEQGEKPRQTMKDGTETKALYIKNISLSDYELLQKTMAEKNITSVADAIRLAIRKFAGVL